MTESKSSPLTSELYEYMIDHNPPLDPVQRALVETTRSLLPESAHLQVAEEQAPLLAFLVRLTGARDILEIGTFTGLSALSMAQALPPGGRLIALDISEEWTAHAREAWAKAGVADRVELRLGDGLESVRALPAEPHLDLVFLDADKEHYVDYWEEVVPRLRPGGLIVADNVFFHGEVVDPGASPAGEGVKAFNDHVAADRRMEAVMLTVADGLTLARKRND
ncbi:O-methyltransferase [Streptomyces mobaraensis NBRC 13819 = DSM 40847]|uniref:O-methyltransferase n=2 Tax=Streptomyces mobaraensis TaxID=35621 RepID=A0A5N5WBP8_STRMB|nr:O-methyltransferase [Streptomyces mobaraensis]EME99268.1 caffeoyl-CoA O-methyltransferase [Streptomyces mobaraensis NBRC 13819 = DSM 40847]KAB7849171.1 O-methyltransferase [Streptomyces mobaraensis]QTT73665.1 O-methyltransferase [Streptomyces mobaraensis NBRC 13819 = DSM 40847]